MDLTFSKLLVAFNTGAVYTKYGQRIAAWCHPNVGDFRELACFIDFDRRIVGTFPAYSGGFGCASSFASHVMHMYSHGQYQTGCPQSVELARMLASRLSDGYRAFIVAHPEIRDLGMLGRPQMRRA